MLWALWRSFDFAAWRVFKLKRNSIMTTFPVCSRHRLTCVELYLISKVMIRNLNHCLTSLQSALFHGHRAYIIHRFSIGTVRRHVNTIIRRWGFLTKHSLCRYMSALSPEEPLSCVCCLWKIECFLSLMPAGEQRCPYHHSPEQLSCERRRPPRGIY